MSVFSRVKGWVGSLFATADTENPGNNDGGGDTAAVSRVQPTLDALPPSPSSGAGSGGYTAEVGSDRHFPIPPWGVREFGSPCGPWGF